MTSVFDAQADAAYCNARNHLCFLILELDGGDSGPPDSGSDGGGGMRVSTPESMRAAMQEWMWASTPEWMQASMGSTAAAAIYRPATGSWSPTRSLLAPRSDSARVQLNNGLVLIVGRTIDGGATTSAELY
jgi:hypothetical protein